MIPNTTISPALHIVFHRAIHLLTLTRTDEGAAGGVYEGLALLLSLRVNSQGGDEEVSGVVGGGAHITQPGRRRKRRREQIIRQIIP